MKRNKFDWFVAATLVLATGLITVPIKVQRELDRFNTAIVALRGANTRNGSKPIGTDSPKPRRTMSAAARKKIAAAQKARWAAWKAKQKKAA